MQRGNVLFYATMALVIVVPVSLALIAAAPLIRGSPIPPTQGGVDHLYMSIALQPANGLDWFTPANFSAPAGEDLQITILNYDPGINNVSGMPSGTSHTFTIVALNLDVPIPAAADSLHPTTTEVDLGVLAPGEYHWVCTAPCDQYAMGAPGYMAGTITVG